MTSQARISRRLVLQAGAATSVLGAPGLLFAQPKPIKIGLVHPVSGGLAYSGGQGRLGCQLAIDAINAAGGIKSMGGAKLEAALGDSQSRPEVGVAEVERLQVELSGLASRADAGQDATAKDLALALETVQAQNLALIEEMRAEFRRELATLKTASVPADPMAAEREAELAAWRAEREAQLQARVSSPSVIFDEGRSSNGAGGVDARMASEDRGGSRDAAGRDFVQSGREATQVEASQVMANPSNTVLQGTLIGAAALAYSLRHKESAH